jgi:hypothetical protein
MKMPRKLKRHLANYLRFLLVYFVISSFVEGWQQFVGFEHYTLIMCGLGAFYFSVSAWFGWRVYTGMVRDMDFDDDDCAW